MAKASSTFLIILFISFLVIPQPAAASTQAQRALLLEQLKQQIEILRYEIQLLQSLISNWQLEQKVTAGAFAAVNLSDNSVILTKNADQAYPIASITKLMTAVIALENIEKDRTITLTEKMLEPLGRSPCLYLELKVSAENLLKAGLIQSTNDATEALAYFLGKEKFLALMNQKAKELGMENTVFYDTHGLNPASLSTTTDLAKLVAYIDKEHPEIWEITRDNNFWLPDPTDRMLKFQNVNNFYPLGIFIGGKSGYLPEAKQTLASVFRVNEKPVAVILLYSDNRQADAFALLKKLRE